MNKQGNWPEKTRQQDLPEVEARLQEMLKPVAPRQEYVQDLERRLILSRNEPYAIISDSELVQITFFVILSLLGSTVLMVLGLRALLAFLSGIGVAHQLQKKRNKAAIYQS